MVVIKTKRLLLRTWEEGDLAPMIAINQDPKVMEHFPALLSPGETKQLIDKINNHYGENGYTLYAVELKNAEEMIGFLGLLNVGFEAHFTPAVEIGWRLAYAHWSKGYASEAARAVLDYAFAELKLKEVVSFTAACNERSIKLMERIGLKRQMNGDFSHTKLPKDHRLSRHVLYRLSRDDYEAGR